MSLKEKLQELKNNLQEDVFRNRDYEFDAELENHPIGNQKIYRLYYINYHRIGENYGMGPSNIGLIDWPCKPFMLPSGMTREEGFKVLSYLTDFIEKRDDVEVGSLVSVRTLDSVIRNKILGFERIEETNEDKILNLFTVGGRLLLFKKSEFYKKYFEWYVEGITREEVDEIYGKIGKEFKDIIWLDKENNKTKKLLKN